MSMSGQASLWQVGILCSLVQSLPGGAPRKPRCLPERAEHPDGDTPSLTTRRGPVPRTRCAQTATSRAQPGSHRGKRGLLACLHTGQRQGSPGPQPTPGCLQDGGHRGQGHQRQVARGLLNFTWKTKLMKSLIPVDPP